MVSCFPSPKTDAKHFDQQEATSVIKLTGDTADADVDENSETRSSVTLRNWLFERLWGLASVALFLLTLTTVVGLLARHHWIADLCANLRTQQVVVLAVLSLIVILYRRWQWLALSVVLMVIQPPSTGARTRFRLVDVETFSQP